MEPLFDSPIIKARYEMIDGRPVCVEITLSRPGREITTDWVRRLPIASLIREYWITSNGK